MSISLRLKAAPPPGSPVQPDFGDFTGVFGGFDSFSGGYHDLEAYGGDIGEIGGFFDRPPDAVEAYDQIFGLSPEDLEALGSDFAHDLIDDLDFFAFYDLDSGIVEDLLHSAEQAGDVLLGGEQWEGILGSLDQEGIFGLSEGLQDSAYDALEGQGFLLLPPDNAEAFFQSTFFGEDTDFSAKLAELGDDAHNLLGAADHDYYLEIGDQIGEIFGSIDFSTLDFETSALAGDDIGALIAAAGEGLQDIGGDDVLGAISLLDVTDFHWEGDVAFDVIELVGLDQLIGSDQAEGIFGSFNLENSDLLGQTLGDQLDDLISDLDFDLHGDLLDGAVFLDAIDPDALAGLELDDVAGLFNSAADIFLVEEDHLGLALDALLGGDGLDLVDPDAFGGAIAGLSGDIILDIFDDLAEAGAILETVGADLFGSGGLGFEGLLGGDTIFDQLDFDAPDDLLDLVGGEVGESIFATLFGT